MTTDSKENYPDCFGKLEIVFPMGSQGLRETPKVCLPCPHKTLCLRNAMQKTEGLKVREERVDRAYQSGMMGFFERWSRKKSLKRRMGKE